MTQYLFQCAIGPVQDFIASARRSRDLWYGSWLLSELAKAAARTLAEEHGMDSLIFPFPGGMDDLSADSEFTVPNKVVALVESDVNEVGRAVKTAIDLRLAQLWQEARAKAGSIDDRLAKRQLADLVEYYWVGVLVEGENYAKARATAEALLAARKSTRNFIQFEGSHIPKSSSDGARESVIPETAYPQGATDSRQDVKIRNLYRLYRARRGEQLSGVDLLKRLGQRGAAFEQKFKSTSHMAAQPYLQMVRRHKGEEAVQQLFDAIQDILREEGIDSEDKDGSLLYEARFRERISDEAALSDVRARLQELLQEWSGTSAEPGTYYALLLADGDNMGRAIDAQSNRRSHQQLSQALSAFAAGVSKTIERYEGVPIFSGGDDVLAYLPVHRVLPCLTRLADDFLQAMKPFAFQVNGTLISPTLSAGIAIVHHLDPLSDSLEQARAAEKEAKKLRAEKHALAVTLSKRSGVDRMIVGPRTEMSERLETMSEFIYAGKIGKGAAYELQELQRLLGKSTLPSNALAGEAVRILHRKRESRRDEAVDDQTRQSFEQWITQQQIPVGQLAQEMIIAAVIADARTMAFGEIERDKENAL